MRQLLEVEGQRGRRDAGQLTDFSRSETRGPGLDQGAVDRQTGILGKGGERGYDGFCFHISMLIEIWKQKQAPPQKNTGVYGIAGLKGLDIGTQRQP
ncbi:MAG: hypothetical protein QG662_2349 [Pseudomonadota bacterium]|nr:hypothetical protein [Pseudomonadota bacterium]